MIVHIKGKVDDEMLEKFIEMYNTESNNYLVYFTSTGGSADTANVIVDLINRYAEKTTIIGYRELLSAGFYIFFVSKCKKELDIETLGMWHQGITDISLNDRGTIAYTNHKAVQKLNKTIGYPKCVELATKLGFNDLEMKEFKKGEDVYFLSDRLNVFLSNSR